MNMHPHAWPLYSADKLLGVEFHETGMNLRPTLPLDEYEFRSPLLGFSKSKAGYEGWYSPSVAGRWEIALALPSAGGERMQQVRVNGSKEQLSKSAAVIRFKGTSAPESPLRWHVS